VNKSRVAKSIVATLVGGLCLSLCASIAQAETAKQAEEKSYAPPVGHPTDVYFGDPHIHTSISADAAMWGNTLSSEDTYKFGLGGEVTSFKGWKAKLARPLDWMVISDHSDVWGFYQRIRDGDPFVLAQPEGVRWNKMIKEGQLTEATDEIIKAFGNETLPWDVSDPKMIAPGWKDTVAAAEKFNDPGNFTAFIAYEWTSNPMGDNLHRVVVYRDNADKTQDILPFTSTGTTGSQDPADLWKVLEAYEEKTGGQVLAIPHNGNWSSGLMFAETI